MSKGFPTDIEMIGNRILVKEFGAAEQKTAGGIFINVPGTGGVPWVGVVIAVGPGEFSADLAREAIESANKEIELSKKALEIGDQPGFVAAVTSQAKNVLEASEACRAAEQESRGHVIPMQCKVGDIVMYQSGIWANSMKVNLDGFGEFLMIRENYVGMIRHRAGTPEAVEQAKVAGVEFGENA